ncbi:hypothetical protein AVEN_144374-1 [Araneus ventricosus]|uniref:Uncharacterized protein n=1 Tax=Araneus ventricosus TaxID=182803 RepID=A0A4Y2E655_ARAVE|nr:hypothetical protein AVEN_144374-1 [Araneus ventricosus]
MYARQFALKGLNENLQSIGESPVKHWRFSESNYCKNKFRNIDDAVHTKVFNIHEQQNDPDYYTHEKCEILQQLQEKFMSTTKKSEKITILTLLPKSWSIKKVLSEFPSATQHMVRTAKNLVKQEFYLHRIEKLVSLCVQKL